MKLKLIKITILILLIYSNINVCVGDTTLDKKITISGYVKDSKTGEELIGATLYVKELSIGTTTNAYGFYSLSLPKGKYTIQISYLGYHPFSIQLNLDSKLSKNLEMVPSNQKINEIVVAGQKKDKNVKGIQMSVQKVRVNKLKELPAVLGETDVLKSITLLPGIQSGGEGSSGIYVRGGSADQNLILLDESPVYNASHLLGFFSVFNPDAIKSMEVYKGAIPAEYGGRLSSLVDIRMKEGNSRKFQGSGTLGLISSKLTLEGPLVKDQASFLLSARRTYVDLFFPMSEKTKDSKLHFYDINAKLNWRLNSKNRLFFSLYSGKDATGMDNVMSMEWGNLTSTLRWNYLISDKLFMNSTFIFSNYNYNIDLEASEALSYDWKAGIRDYNLKFDFDYFISPTNKLKFGLGSIHHEFRPGEIKVSESSMFNSKKTATKNALESNIYVSLEQKVGENLSLRYGLRFSEFKQIGGGTEYQYLDPNNPTKENLIEGSEKTYKRFDNIKSYYGLEPRFAANLTLNASSSMKFSYNRTKQYIHLITNTNSPTPLDVWTPSSRYIKPQLCDQFILGYFKNFAENTIEASIEGYYKDMQNQIDFVDYADLLLNDHVETEVRSGNAYSYGFEVMLKKNYGNFTGWANYTFSKTRRKIDEINNGVEYAPPYDRTHDFKFVGTYKINDKWNIGATWKYSTGMAITLPVAKYKNEGRTYFVYEEGGRGKNRAPAFHRLDFSVNYIPKPHSKKRWKGKWNFSIVNLYGRKNAYSVYFKEDPDNQNKANAYQLSILGTMLPSVSYSVNF